jgi:hypothetical protein
VRELECKDNSFSYSVSPWPIMNLATKTLRHRETIFILLIASSSEARCANWQRFSVVGVLFMENSNF